MTDMNRPPEDSAEDINRLSRLASSGTKPTDPVPHDLDADPAADATVREYEARYFGPRTEAPPARGDSSRIATPAPRRRDVSGGLPRSYSTARVSDEERLWAAVAHGSAWITFLGGIFSIGAIIPVSIFIPLVIYFLFRRRSDFVAFHALQAFVLQLTGTVGAFALLLVGGIAWGIGMLIALAATLVLVGFILVPIWGIVGIALLLVITLLPLAMVLFGTIAAFETYNGRDYRYPYIAGWVDRQMAGSYLHTV